VQAVDGKAHLQNMLTEMLNAVHMVYSRCCWYHAASWLAVTDMRFGCGQTGWGYYRSCNVATASCQQSQPVISLQKLCPTEVKPALCM